MQHLDHIVVFIFQNLSRVAFVCFWKFLKLKSTERPWSRLASLFRTHRPIRLAAKRLLSNISSMKRSPNTYRCGPPLFLSLTQRSWTGELDFYINGTSKWALEMLRNGAKVGEHMQRFDENNGKYRKVNMSDYLVVDCYRIESRMGSTTR